MNYENTLIREFTNKALLQNKDLLSIDKIALKTVGDFGKVCTTISETNTKNNNLALVKRKVNCKKYLRETLLDLTLLANKLGITLEELMVENLSQV